MSQHSISIRDQTYFVKKTGHGTPCLLIGLGTLIQRSLSSVFQQHFEVFASDTYWVAEGALDDISQVTMNTILNDIKAIGEALNLQKYVILAHSAYGIVALEFAKQYPDIASAIIMIGTPVNSSPAVAIQNNAIFDSQADNQRKQIDAARRTQIAQENLSQLTFSEQFLWEYIFRDAPRYWYNPSYDCTHLWEGITLDKIIGRFFVEILPNVDVTQQLETIQIPIFLAAGLSDYDCCPWLWQNLSNLPPHMTISIFEKSGHWPQFEEPELFDERVINWLKNIK